LSEYCIEEYRFIMRNSMKDPRDAKPSNLVQSLQRVSLLLDTLGQRSQGSSVRDLSQRVKLPKATTHRLLSSLQYLGYVRQDPETRNYFLGFKLVELGNLLLAQLDLRREAEPFLRGLAERTNETVHLVFLDRYEIVYIDKLETNQTSGGLKMASRIGSRNPAHSSAVGKVLLAHLPAGEFEEFVRLQGLPRRTEKTITDPLRFREHLKAVRGQGFALDEEENEKGIRCVAAPVYNAAGTPAAAISVSAPAFRISRKPVEDFLRKEVMETAREISRRLGYRGGLLEGTPYPGIPPGRGR
jgi:IclR family transcriptional regulator, KDG regulon repressor